MVEGPEGHGGEVKPPFDLAAHCRAIASKGGRATVEKYGVAHMSAIGKQGFQALVETRGFSDAGHAIAWMIERGMIPRKKEP